MSEAEKNITQGKKIREGLVVSDKMDKSVVVAVSRQVKHPTYGKIIRRTKKYVAHDEANTCDTGDLVRIIETRPMSRTKRWKVESILVKAEKI